MESSRNLGKVLTKYFSKMKGHRRSIGRPGVSPQKIKVSLWAWIGSSLGIGLCALLSSEVFEAQDTTLIIGSFGASAVLLYGMAKSPLAQPRSLVGGHLLSGTVGVACYLFLGTDWIAAALAVSFAIAAMILTDTVHPPGGATALIAVIGGPTVHQLGFWYVLAPVGLGTLILLSVALLVNNLSSDLSYPEYWY